jgi:CBS domain-containing protein
MQVKNIMSRKVEIVDAETPIKSAAEKMMNCDVGLLPVREGSQLVGMLSDRDITIRATACGLDPEKTAVKEIVTPGVTYCFENQSIEEAADRIDAGESAAPAVGSQSTKESGGNPFARRFGVKDRCRSSGGKDRQRRLAVIIGGFVHSKETT